MEIHVTAGGLLNGLFLKDIVILCQLNGTLSLLTAKEVPKTKLQMLGRTEMLMSTDDKLEA